MTTCLTPGAFFYSLLIFFFALFPTSTFFYCIYIYPLYWRHPPFFSLSSPLLLYINKYKIFPLTRIIGIQFYSLLSSLIPLRIKMKSGPQKTR